VDCLKGPIDRRHLTREKAASIFLKLGRRFLKLEKRFLELRRKFLELGRSSS
jgi:hypothetical protein